MRTFVYRRWSGGEKTIEADRVEFTPTHVVFWRDEMCSGPDTGMWMTSTIVLAERPEQVNALRETTAALTAAESSGQQAGEARGSA